MKRYTDGEFAEIYNRNINSVYRICFMYMKSKSDAEDATQNVFLKLYERGTEFNDFMHEQGWLIKTAVNLCKDSLKSFWNKTVAFDEQLDSDNYVFLPETDETLAKIMKLPPDIKTALYLHYYEGYNSAQIAKITGKIESTVRGYLRRGREKIKKEILSEKEKA